MQCSTDPHLQAAISGSIVVHVEYTVYMHCTVQLNRMAMKIAVTVCSMKLEWITNGTCMHYHLHTYVNM